jgi:hypothetical protein
LSIGPDIKEVLIEVGTPFTILRDAGDITGEFADIELNQQVTKPFIREFFLQGTFSYDTAVIPGDTITIPDGRNLLVMNRTPELFEGVIMSFDCVLYKANVIGAIYRPVETRVNYQTVTTWQLIKADVPALITEALYGNELDTDEILGKLGLSEDDMYIPGNLDLQVMDRFEVSASEYYRIEVIKSRRFEATNLVMIGEDTRGPRP